MNQTEWRYHNHALLPVCAPHEVPNTDCVLDGSLFKKYKKALLARWTTDWGISESTGWYYLCRFKPFSIEELSKSARKSIRKALRNCTVEMIDPSDHLDEMWNVYKEAYEGYTNPIGMTTEEEFKNSLNNRPRNREYWAAFETKSNKMIGYDVVTVYKEYVSDTVGKYSQKYKKLGACDAITFSLLEYYLSKDHIQYVTDGERTVSHDTNIHNYLEQRFRFERVNCRLNIKYRGWVHAVVLFVYPFRNIVKKIDNKLASQVYGVLCMEEIKRTSKQL